MKYNFDEIITRTGTDCVKYDGAENIFGTNDLIPMWVADMDFRTPPFVMEAMRRYLDNEVLGYPTAYPEWALSIKQWLLRRHQWHIEEEMLTFIPGIVKGQAFALLAISCPQALQVVIFLFITTSILY